MPTPDKQALSLSYKTTMNDMQQELRPLERIYSRVIHSPLGALISKILESVVLRPRSILIGSGLAITTILGAYVTAFIYATPFSNIEPLIAFVFGWCIGVLYDLFFVATKRHSR